MIFDLLLKHNSSNKWFAFSAIEPNIDNGLYYTFNDFQMPETAPYGEYVYFLVEHDENMIEYIFKDTPLNTIVRTDTGAMLLKDLKPLTGLLKFHNPEHVNPSETERDTSKEIIYRKRNEN